VERFFNIFFFCIEFLDIVYVAKSLHACIFCCINQGKTMTDSSAY